VFAIFTGTGVVVIPVVPDASPVDAAVTTAFPEAVLDFSVTVAIPFTAFITVAVIKVPAPLKLKVTEFVAVVTIVSTASHNFDVISDVAVPFAAIVTCEAVFISFAGTWPVATLIVPCVSPPAAAVTTGLPAVKVDLSVTVALPDAAFITVVPISVPCPLTLKVTEFVAVVTAKLLLSLIVAVISAVLVASASITDGDAVLSIFIGGFCVVVMLIVPCVSPPAAAVTTALPEVIVDLSVTVAIPPEAFTTVVVIKVPLPLRLKVTEFAAVVIKVLFVSCIYVVISDVAVPFACIVS
jgi:hypothetical protein